MNITAAQVNELRQKTGAGMMDCKKALVEAEGDLTKAIEILRKKGAAVAAKRAERSANEGIVATLLSEDKSYGTIIEVNCETDFVAKSDDFVSFTNESLKSAFDLEADSVEDLLSKNSSLNDRLLEITGKVGEKTEIKRIRRVVSDGGFVTSYIHPGSKLGCIVRFDSVPADKASDFYQTAFDITLQVAAMKPVSVSRDEVDPELVKKELEIYKEQLINEGKSEQIAERAATGRLDKFFKENCLLEQEFFKDNTKQVRDLITEYNKINSSGIKLHSFARFHLADENK